MTKLFDYFEPSTEMGSKKLGPVEKTQSSSILDAVLECATFFTDKRKEFLTFGSEWHYIGLARVNEALKAGYN